MVADGAWGSLEYCPVCHLIWPCLDGKILAYAERMRRHGLLTVNQIRALIEAEHDLYVPDTVLPPPRFT